MASRGLISYEEAGGKPGPLRAALLEEARKHLEEPKKRYMILMHSWMTSLCDWRNVEIRARSTAECCVAFLDFVNSNVRQISAGRDHAEYDIYDRQVSDDNEEYFRAEATRLESEGLEKGYPNCYTDYWVTMWPEEPRRVAPIPELRAQTELSGAAGERQPSLCRATSKHQRSPHVRRPERLEEPGPVRAALLEEARKHLEKPMIRYIIAAVDVVSIWTDWKNIEIWASSQAEAVLTLFDFLSSVEDFFIDTPKPPSRSPYHFEQKPGKSLEECVRARITYILNNYVDIGRSTGSEPYFRYWLIEWPEESRRASVPELQELTKAARD